jgi:shikimate 5-dehydrogenase
MHRWTHLSQFNQDARFLALSKFLNDHGFANEYVPLKEDPESYFNELNSRVEFDSIRVGSPFGESLLRMFVQLPVTILHVKSGDCLIARRGTWWPENFLTAALPRLFARELYAIDLKAGAMIVGTGAAARTGVIACARLGFNRITVTDQFDERGQLLIQEMKKILFNVDLQFMPESHLTSLPGIYSLLVNTTPPVSSNTVVQQLSYFNFMKAGGAVLDYALQPGDTILIREGRDVGIKVVYGHRIAAYHDLVWAQALAGREFDVDAYHAKIAPLYAETAPDPTADKKTTVDPLNEADSSSDHPKSTAVDTESSGVDANALKVEKSST